MVSQDKKIKNIDKFFKTSEEYGFMPDSLLEFLGQEFLVAPASTSTNLHNAFEGGLISHLLLTAKYSIAINNSLPESLRIDKASLLKVSLLFQIGKTKLYTTEGIKNWQIERGINYNFNEDLVSLSVGERSIYYMVKYGVDFTEEEYQAIINHDKDDSDKQAKWYSNTLTTILKQANELAIIEEKTKING